MFEFLRGDGVRSGVHCIGDFPNDHVFRTMGVDDVRMVIGYVAVAEAMNEQDRNIASLHRTRR